MLPRHIRARPASALLCFVLLLAGVGVWSGCSKPPPPPPLKLDAIEFGNAVDAENKIVSPTRKFTPQSTVYLSIKTVGSGTGTLFVEWAANSTVVDGQKQNHATILEQQTLEIHPSELAHFAFHFVPTDGWPTGMNMVRFWLKGGWPDEEKHVGAFEVE